MPAGSPPPNKLNRVWPFLVTDPKSSGLAVDFIETITIAGAGRGTIKPVDNDTNDPNYLTEPQSRSLQATRVALVVSVEQAIETDIAQPIQALVTVVSGGITLQGKIKSHIEAVSAHSPVNKQASSKVLFNSFFPEQISVGQASETDLAQPIAASKSLALNLAQETDLAQSISASQSIQYRLNVILQGTSQEVIQKVPSFTPDKSGSKSKLSIRLPISINVPVGLAQETDTAQSVSSSKSLAIGQAQEIDTSQSISLSVKGYVTLQGVPQNITRAVSNPVSYQTESFSQNLQGFDTSGFSITVGRAEETDIAQSISVFTTTLYKLNITLQGKSQSSIQAVSAHNPDQLKNNTRLFGRPTKAISVGQVVETDTSQPFTSSKSLALGQAQETDTAQSISFTSANSIRYITLQGVPQGLSRAVTNLVQYVTEPASQTLQGATSIGWVIELVQARETDIAQPISVTTNAPKVPPSATFAGKAKDTIQAVPAHQKQALKNEPRFKAYLPRVLNIDVGQAQEYDLIPDASGSVMVLAPIILYGQSITVVKSDVNEATITIKGQAQNVIQAVPSHTPVQFKPVTKLYGRQTKAISVGQVIEADTSNSIGVSVYPRTAIAAGRGTGTIRAIVAPEKIQVKKESRLIRKPPSSIQNIAVGQAQETDSVNLIGVDPRLHDFCEVILGSPSDSVSIINVVTSTTVGSTITGSITSGPMSSSVISSPITKTTISEKTQKGPPSEFITKGTGTGNITGQITATYATNASISSIIKSVIITSIVASGTPISIIKGSTVTSILTGSNITSSIQRSTIAEKIQRQIGDDRVTRGDLTNVITGQTIIP